jgi:hypothetical protein
VVKAPIIEEKIDTGPTSMESDVGGLNQEEVDEAFSELGVEECIEQGSARIGELGGEFKLRLRIRKSGETRWVYLSESTLGDRETEKCLLDRAREKSWPKPLGGEGIAEKSFAIDPAATPVAIDAKRLRREIARARVETAKCREGIGGSFFATVYLRSDGGVRTAGIAVPNEKGEGVADCMIEALQKLRFRESRGRSGKVSFELR